MRNAAEIHIAHNTSQLPAAQVNARTSTQHGCPAGATSARSGSSAARLQAAAQRAMLLARVAAAVHLASAVEPEAERETQ
ncbi:MAG: hypothetical protein ACR2GY_05515 [Phycisphaerales bacterium]